MSQQLIRCLVSVRIIETSCGQDLCSHISGFERRRAVRLTLRALFNSINQCRLTLTLLLVSTQTCTTLLVPNLDQSPIHGALQEKGAMTSGTVAVVALPDPPGKCIMARGCTKSPMPFANSSGPGFWNVAQPQQRHVDRCCDHGTTPSYRSIPRGRLRQSYL